VGGSGYGETSERSLVDTVQCGIYRRDALEAVGSFDPAMNFGEDEELNWRLRRAGHEILLDTRIRFHYVTRPSWAAAYRQYRNYGRSRVRVVRKHPDYLRPYHLVPAAAVGGGALLAAAGVVSRPARRVLVAGGAAYAATVGTAALALDRRQASRVALAFVALHAGYGIGMLREVLKLGAGRG
jgi:GT2 family glycosyltransferase